MKERVRVRGTRPKMKIKKRVFYNVFKFVY